tara:strand:- start:216 stop:395 length:180 start_codon:yes stop_codon:yes gene_type:complete
MIKYICNFLFPSKSEKLKKEIAKKYKEAVNFQRNGNIREYSVLMNEITNLEDRLVELQK